MSDLPPQARMVARAIVESRFTPVRMRSGYAMRDVDTMLDDAERAARAMEPLEPVLHRPLPHAAVRETYKVEDVDALVERLLTGSLGRAYESVRRGDPQAELSADRRRAVDLVCDARFRTRLLKGGYAVTAVQQRLDDLMVAICEGQSLGPLLGAPLEQIKRGNAYDAGDVDRLLDQLRSLG